jgi:acyl dehydratase
VTVAEDAFSVDALGRPGEEAAYDVDAEAIRAYAEATDETVEAARSGAVAPPVFAIVPAWPTIAPASLSVASVETRKRAVHYAQDMRLHVPIEPGMRLVARTTPLSLLERPNGSALVLLVETRTVSGELVNEQYVTEFFRGVAAPETIGEPAPAHRLETDADPIDEVTYRIADDQTARYAAASGDDFAIHLDDAFARAVGLPGRIVHGLCTLAFAARAVLEAAGVDDPREVRRLAARFSAPLFPGESLTTRVWEVDGGYGFEALNDEGRAVLKDGRVELA